MKLPKYRYCRPNCEYCRIGVCPRRTCGPESTACSCGREERRCEFFDNKNAAFLKWKAKNPKTLKNEYINTISKDVRKKERAKKKAKKKAKKNNRRRK